MWEVLTRNQAVATGMFEKIVGVAKRLLRAGPRRVSEMMELPKYMVSGYEHEDAGGAVVFTFVQRGLPQEHGPGGARKRRSEFVVTVRQVRDGLEFDWSGSPDDPGPVRNDIQGEIATRMEERAVCIGRVKELVDVVDGWARELGWSTRRVEKKLDDARVGTHRVPALLLQAETCRIILEPVGRSAPGVEGVVDLYLMPAYDDIASIYYYGDRWMMHYLFPNSKPAPTVREAMTLSKEALQSVLAEMKQHAA
jgi:hypothetical protein